MTTTDLRDRLADLAEEARGYADPDAALARARRRRVSRLAAPVAAAAVAAVLAGAISALPLAGDRGRTGPDSDIGFGQSDDYPPVVTRPAKADRLPFGTPLDPAAFFYVPCPRITVACWPILVMPDGRQYAVPMTIDSGLPRDLSLSPDGRYAVWGYEGDGGIEVLDLRRNTYRHVGLGQYEAHARPVAWSPETRWLLLAEHDGGAVRRYLLVDLRGGVRELPASVVGPGESVVGVRDSGELVLRSAGRYEQLPVIRVVDPSSGKELHRVQPFIPASASWRMGRDARVTGAWLHACSCVLTLIVAESGLPDGATTLVEVDVEQGHMISVTSLPESAASGAVEPGVWTVGGHPPGSIVLVHRHPGGTDIVLQDTIKGRRQVVSRLPYDSYPVVRAPVVMG